LGFHNRPSRGYTIAFINVHQSRWVWTVSTLSLSSFPTQVLPVLSVRNCLCILCIPPKFRKLPSRGNMTQQKKIRRLTYIYTFWDRHTYIYTSIDIFAYTNICTYICIFVYIFVYIYIYIYVHIYLHIHIYNYIYLCIYCIHIWIYIYI